jgi:hypothetical protein
LFIYPSGSNSSSIRFPNSPRQREGQRQAGVVLSRLDRVHGLPRDVQPLGQLGLRPPALAAKLAHAVAHLLTR